MHLPAYSVTADTSERTRGNKWRSLNTSPCFAIAAYVICNVRPTRAETNKEPHAKPTEEINYNVKDGYSYELHPS